MIDMFLALIAGHAICDFTFQTDTMAKGKNRNRPPAEPPPGQAPQTMWPYWLSAHAAIHGGAVGLITGVWWLGVFEAATHAAIDFGKCENWYGIHADQAMHIGCKAVWFAVAVWLVQA